MNINLSNSKVSKTLAKTKEIIFSLFFEKNPFHTKILSKITIGKYLEIIEKYIIELTSMDSGETSIINCCMIKIISFISWKTENINNVFKTTLILFFLICITTKDFLQLQELFLILF